MSKIPGSAGCKKRFQTIAHSFSRSSKRAETRVTRGDLVLIVEDDDMVRRCLARLIRTRGFRVEAYSSAETFLIAKEKDEAVCLLLDATLTGMSGLELQRQLGDESRCIPIVFMSANDEPSVRAQALRGGAIAFLLKPFKDEALWSALEAVASQSGERTSRDGHVEVTSQGEHHASRKVERSKNHW
jgi:FixJ family two-component response regulator